MVTISNDVLTAEFFEKGAEIHQISLYGEPQMWCADPNIWGKVSPVMFPICGGLLEDKFTYKGKTYHLPKHGFAQLKTFQVEHLDKTSVTFLFCSDAETLEMYPWQFEFRVTYALLGSRMEVRYNIKNLSDDTMYAAVGSHEGYACPGGIENYDLIFEKEETLDSLVLDGNLYTRNRNRLLYKSRVLPLYEKYFAIDAITFPDIRSRYVTLRNRITGKEISVSFPGKNNLVVWHKQNAEYICIETWSGLPSFTDKGLAIEDKETMQQIAAKSILSFTHNIFFE